MMTLKRCQNKSEWDDYILENGGHPLQLWGWGELKSGHGWHASRLFAYNDSEQVIGAVQILIRKLPPPFRSIAYAPRGPIIGDDNRDEFLGGLSNFVKSHYHSVSLTIEPDSEEFAIPSGWKKAKNRILPSQTVILDLNRSESELLADMAKKTRQYIRKSAAEAIQIKTVKTQEDLLKCLSIYKETAKRAKFALHSDHYYIDAFDRLGDHSPVFAVYIDGQPIAFLWLAISADTAFELYGGVNELGQQLRVNYALKWHAIQKCKEWGLTRYDFGGLIEGGVSTFKMGWTEKEVELAGTFDRPLSPFYELWVSGLPLAKKTIQKIKSIISKH
jgi:lipid II:glycine glycyltransferase (peptidoglycan interpeptide bridge formation enzyme)